MTRSMTAFAQCSTKNQGGLSWTVEIHSVNRKMLDIHLHLPRELVFMDMDFRKVLSKQLHRGQVNIRFHQRKGKEDQLGVPKLKKLKSYWEKIAKELHFSKEEISLSFLLEQMNEPEIEEEIGASVQTELKKVLEKATGLLVKMRETEGKALAADILKRLKSLMANVDAIEELAANSPTKRKASLIERLEELMADAANDERILREVAIFAEKADISEEITRLNSHCKQMSDLFQSKEESIGRTLDFLTQEMLREINTISSKSNDLAITKKTIAVKAELEKIREQVQNIE